MNRFDRKVNKEANRRQDEMYEAIENKYPDETVMTTAPTDNPFFCKLVPGPNIDNYISDIEKVPSIYKLKKQIRKELKSK